MHPLAGLILLLAAALLLCLAALTLFLGYRLQHPPRNTAGAAIARNLPTAPDELPAPLAYDEYTLNLTEPRRRAPHTVHLWSVEGRDPEGPVVIATPGWSDSRMGALSRLGDRTTTGLATNASRVIAWDPPGAGASPGQCYLGTREPELILKLMVHARHTLPHRPVVLFGWSLGAGASIAAAAIAEHTPDLTPPAAVVAEAPYRIPLDPARNVVRMGGYPTLTLPLLALAMGIKLRAGASTTWHTAHRGTPFDRAKQAARLANTPLLVVHGDNDPISPFNDGKAIADAAPDAAFHPIPNGGHNNLWRDPAFRDTIAPAVAAFIARFANAPTS